MEQHQDHAEGSSRIAALTLRCTPPEGYKHPMAAPGITPVKSVYPFTATVVWCPSNCVTRSAFHKPSQGFNSHPRSHQHTPQAKTGLDRYSHCGSRISSKFHLICKSFCQSYLSSSGYRRSFLTRCSPYLCPPPAPSPQVSTSYRLSTNRKKTWSTFC